MLYLVVVVLDLMGRIAVGFFAGKRLLNEREKRVLVEEMEETASLRVLLPSLSQERSLGPVGVNRSRGNLEAVDQRGINVTG